VHISEEFDCKWKRTRSLRFTTELRTVYRFLRRKFAIFRTYKNASISHIHITALLSLSFFHFHSIFFSFFTLLLLHFYFTCLHEETFYPHKYQETKDVISYKQKDFTSFKEKRVNFLSGDALPRPTEPSETVACTRRVWASVARQNETWVIGRGGFQGWSLPPSLTTTPQAHQKGGWIISKPLRLSVCMRLGTWGPAIWSCSYPPGPFPSPYSWRKLALIYFTIFYIEIWQLIIEGEYKNKEEKIPTLIAKRTRELQRTSPYAWPPHHGTGTLNPRAERHSSPLLFATFNGLYAPPKHKVASRNVWQGAPFSIFCQLQNTWRFPTCLTYLVV
jgi:hypothetical protein